MAKKAFDIGEFAKTITVQVSESDTSGQRIEMIDIALIHPNQSNFYQVEPDLSELQNSIQVNGLLEPIIVRKIDDGYRIISGHRRYRACFQMNHRISDSGQRLNFDQIPCLVIDRDMTEAEEGIALIEANHQRVKTPYERSHEAELLTQYYVKLKAEGAQLPGKIRDRVAEQLEMSRTHLARLAAIKNNLKVPGFERDFKEDRLSESVAYEISKLSHDAQYRLLDYSIERGQPVTTPLIKRFSTIYSMVGSNKCSHAKGLCANVDRMYDLFYKGGSWNCAGCCEKCLKRETCPGACQYIKKAESVPVPTAPVNRNPALDDPRVNWQHVRDAFCSRLTALRTATGLSRKDFAESIDRYPNTYSAWENASLPGSEQIPVLALALGVSTDYLYGLSDNPAVSSAPSAPQPAWIPLTRGTWPVEGQLCLLAYENGLGGYQYQLARCVAGADDKYPFIDPNNDLTCEDFGDFEIWTPLKEACKK